MASLELLEPGQRPGPWRTLPFFAVCSVIATVSFLACCALDFRTRTTQNQYGAPTSRKTLVLALLLTGLAVLPAGLWFGHHRADLGVGLNHYLVDRTLESVARARESHRIDRLRAQGVASAPAGDGARLRLNENFEPRETWLARTLRHLVAYSRLSNELMLYRALPPDTAERAVSFYGVFHTTFGYDIPWPLSGRDLPRFIVLSLVLLLLMTAAIAAIAYSICAVCTIVRSRRVGVVKLPDADCILENAEKGEPFLCKPLRAIVLYRSEEDLEKFVEKLQKSFSPRRHHFDAKASRRCSVEWIPKPQAKHEALHVFRDLKQVLQNDCEGRALFHELQRLATNEQSAVLLFSRVAPDYRYSDRLGTPDRWLDSPRRADADPPDRWTDLAPRFCSYVLRCTDRREEFEQLIKGTAANRNIKHALLREVRANPDLLHVAWNALANLDKRSLEDPYSWQLAVTTFRKSAASYFNRIWTESTREERLQLYALAHRGVVDSRRAAALSSLLHRGLVREDPDTAVVRLRSDAFGEFIEHDVDLGTLNAWRSEGDGGSWRFIWPPLAITAALGLAFLALANPEMRATLLTTLLGLVPAALPLLRGAPGGSPPQP